MLPQIMVLLGFILALLWSVSPLLPILGGTLLLAGGSLWRQIYDRGNVFYNDWRFYDERWKIATEKRKTILDRMANAIDQFSGFEGAILRDMSADRSAAGFLMQSFPTIETMTATRDLYQQIVAVETEINQLRQETAKWNKEVQQLVMDGWFNLCLPSGIRQVVNPTLTTPSGDLSPDPDAGLSSVNTRQW